MTATRELHPFEHLARLLPHDMLCICVHGPHKLQSSTTNHGLVRLMERSDTHLSDSFKVLSDRAMAVIDEYRPPLPPVLYHYTTTDGLLNIIPTGRIWSTDVRYFNDWMELQYALHKIADVFVNKMDVDVTDKLIQLIFDAIGPLTIIRYEVLRSKFQFHATCFSTQGDDLYQWRAYSQATEGYAIGFRAEDLCEFGIHNIIYEEVYQIEVVKKLITLWREILEGFANNQSLAGSQYKERIRQVIQSVICTLALQFKDHRFAAEREWRIIGNISGKNVMYRNGRVGLTPYVSLDLRSAESSKMPIVSVTQGPRAQPDLEAEALRGFLAGNGYEKVEIKMSEVPIRF